MCPSFSFLFFQKADVRRRLPKIQDELEKSIHKAQSSLSLLPKAPSSDPRNEILSLLHEFMTDVSRHVEGVPDEDGLLQAIRPAQDRFRRAVRGTAPKFRPFERKYKGERRLAPAAFLSFEEGEGGGEEDADGDEEDAEQQGAQATNGGGEGRKRKHGDVVGHDVIYIDEVYERAHRLVSFPTLLFPTYSFSRQSTDERVTGQLPLRRPSFVYQQYY